MIVVLSALDVNDDPLRASYVVSNRLRPVLFDETAKWTLWARHILAIVGGVRISLISDSPSLPQPGHYPIPLNVFIFPQVSS